MNKPEDRKAEFRRTVDLYRPFSHVDFLTSLRGLNASAQDANWLYAPTSDTSPWQGDIAADVSLIYADPDGQTATLDVGPAMLLSPGCDTEPGRVQYVSMAPVAPLTSLVPSGSPPSVSDPTTSKIRSNQVSTLLYLPGVSWLPDSFVDFERVCPVPQRIARSRFASLDSNAARIRLSDVGWRFVMAKYWYHTARDENRIDFPRQ